MFSRFQLAKKYIHYYFTSLNKKGHGTHSPFVFDFVKNVLNDRKNYKVYENVESIRRQLLGNSRMLEVLDLGAGSVINKNKQRTLGSITASAVKPKKFGQLLFRIVRYYRPKNILELGTSLGITSSYLALANSNASVITLEGSPEVAEIALANFSKLAINNITLQPGNFDDTLKQALQDIEVLDLAFIDGNHRKEPTLRYFHTLLAKINNASILIFDDIHWSAEMEEAWEIIKMHPSVTLSVDLFFIGLIFFRNDFKVKQHFVINF